MNGSADGPYRASPGGVFCNSSIAERIRRHDVIRALQSKLSYPSAGVVRGRPAVVTYYS
jgi:hypothetical protein